ncbi:4-hydroxy-3-methylbut-2-en-1-yl diphosphate synthase [Stappia sp.]|uniref:4-hydroxy-3-methylbut-2-en-1-yl diphosphate synthase n=1 Tax=Stappia sp. TaxID=1870903 RepID=UPI0032D8F0D0
MLLTVLSRTLDLARTRIGTLFAAGWGYMLLLVALNVAISVSLTPASGGFTTGSYMMEPIVEGTGTADREAALRLLAVLANIAAGFSIGVAYLRRLLLGRHEFFLAFGARNLRVAWKLVVLGVLGVVFLIPLTILSGMLVPITGPIGVFAMIASPFVAVMLVQRVSLVLPAAALDDAMTLKESWRLTRGIGWALAVAALAVSVLGGVGVAVWALVLSLADIFVSGTGPVAQLRSALLPMGAMVIVTWLFASLHATAYALARERFADEVGLKLAEMEEAEARRRAAHRSEARRAVDVVRGRSGRANR